MIPLRFGIGCEFVLIMAEKMKRLLLDVFADLAWSKVLRSSGRRCGGSPETVQRYASGVTLIAQFSRF